MRVPRCRERRRMAAACRAGAAAVGSVANWWVARPTAVVPRVCQHWTCGARCSLVSGRRGGVSGAGGGAAD